MAKTRGFPDRRLALNAIQARLQAVYGSRLRGVVLYGSFAKGVASPESDIDVLVEFEPGKGPGYFGLFDMEEELSGILGGRKVDMRTPKELSRYFRQDVIESAVVEYTA